MHESERLHELGFARGKTSAHTARTMMLDELAQLFAHVPSDAAREEYVTAIRDLNCLGKRSVRTRGLTARHLTELYGLNPANSIHMGLRYFWERDQEARPLLALLAAIARDTLLRDMLPVILAVAPGMSIHRTQVEAAIEQRWPDRFSPATLKSVAQNLNSSLTQSGHLTGRVKKLRQQAKATPGAAAFALYLGWLRGERGEMLLQTEFCRALDCVPERILELAAQAAKRGWMQLRQVDTVIEPGFPALKRALEPLTAKKKGARA
jgi:hypothetical protein